MRSILQSAILIASIIAGVLAEPAAEMRAKKPRSSSASSDSCPSCGECFKNYITKMDFYHVYPVLSGANQNWHYYTDGLVGDDYQADDGILRTGCHGGIVDSKFFNLTDVNLSYNRFNDNMKYLILADANVNIPKNGDLVIEFDAAAETFRVNENPFPAPMTQVSDDARMGYGIFTSIDLDTGLMMSWLLTNDRVYVVYSRIVRPGRTDVFGDNYYASFTFVIPVKMRVACDFNDMKIVWHGSNKQVSWRLDGREVFRVTKVGYLIDRQYMAIDLGGQEGPVFPESVTYGFGTGDMLNGYPICKSSDVCCDCMFPTLRQGILDTGSADNAVPSYNPLLGAPNPAVYWQNTPDADLSLYNWGQGVVVKIRKLLVYQDYCATRKC